MKIIEKIKKMFEPPKRCPFATFCGAYLDDKDKICNNHYQNCKSFQAGKNQLDQFKY